MPSNQTITKAMSLIFSLCNIASAQEVPFGIPKYIQCILHGLINALLYVPFIFAASKKCQFGDGFLFVTEIFLIFHTVYFDYTVAFQFVLVGNGLNTAGNEA